MKKNKISGKERVLDILTSVDRIKSFTNGYNLEDFLNDERGYFACLYQFAVIGEAIMNIGEEILSKYDYPWYKVRAFRNFILHEYHAIDQQVVWETIVEIMPGFHLIMNEILQNEF